MPPLGKKKSQQMQLDKHGVMAIDHKSVLAAMHTKTAVCKMQSDG